jgi:menaquinol-cytochrome c reductase iron-sulfur subunit
MVDGLDDTTRRRFLKNATIGMLAFVSAALGSVLAAFAIPRAGRRTPVWVVLAPLDSVPEDTFRTFRVRVPRQHGWMMEEVERVVYARRTTTGVLVLSSTCTHLGCAVRWRAGTGEFQCPCHGGVYDADGAVKDGPPPAPLARYMVRESAGLVEISSV